MATTAGVVTLVSKTSTTVNLNSAAATGGTGPYTYQWYRSTTSGFSPGAGNLIAGATSLNLADTGLIPGTNYFYVMRATDSGAVTGDSAQFAAQTLSPVQNVNAFAQSPQLGMIDLRFDPDTVSVMISPNQATALFAGAAVKIDASAGNDGVPKVIGCAANADEVFGFLNYDIKSQDFRAGKMAECSQAGNVMYLYSTTAITRGTRVTLDLSTNGGVGALVGSSGNDVVGWAYDGATAAGQLIRVKLITPGYLKA